MRKKLRRGGKKPDRVNIKGRKTGKRGKGWLTEPRGKKGKQEWFTGMGRESDEGKRGERVARVN